MVAHSATTSLRDTSPGDSAPFPSLPSSPPPRSSASSAFNTSSDSPSSSDSSLIPAHLHSPILSALCHPGSSLCSVARDFRIAVDILAMWLTEPDTREKMLLIEKGGCAHTRMAASVTLASTVGVLQTIIDDYTEARAHARQLRAQHEHLASAASRHDPLPPSHLNQSADRAFLPGEAILGDTSLQAQRLELRRAEGARRACHHLYRLSRIVPIDDSILARAAELHRTARVIERTSPSDSSPPGTTPGGTTLQTGAPAARATDTPRVRTPDAASPPLPLVPSSSSPRSSASSAFNSSSDSASSSASSDSSDSSPEGRTVRCHGFQPVESDHPNTSSSSSHPPPGRTTRFIDEDADPRASDTPAPVPRPSHEA